MGVRFARELNSNLDKVRQVTIYMSVFIYIYIIHITDSRIPSHLPVLVTHAKLIFIALTHRPDHRVESLWQKGTA